MLRAFLHRLVANPRVYDFVQRFVGRDYVRRRLLKALDAAQPLGRTVDVGGGTGAITELLPPDSEYVCLDYDPRKLQGFRRRSPAGRAIVANAAHIPLADASFDTI